MAQDFHAAFGLGHDDKTISMLDAQGVAFAAIQGLHHATQGLHQAMQEKDREISDLRRKLQAIEAKLGL